MDIDGVGLGAVIGGIITAAGVVLVNVLTKRHGFDRENRSDTRTELEKLVERQDQRITHLETENARYQKENANLMYRVGQLEQAYHAIAGKPLPNERSGQHPPLPEANK